MLRSLLYGYATRTVSGLVPGRSADNVQVWSVDERINLSLLTREYGPSS